MAAAATTRYAKSGNVHIAYQVIGEGPQDLVLVWGGLSHVELMWEEPTWAHFFEALASFSRLILFDKRGTGLSDRLPFGGLDERMEDIRAVLDAARSDQAFIVSESEGAALAALFAATNPGRVRGLVFYAPLVRVLREPGFPWGHDAATFDAYVALALQHWGDGTMLSAHAPSETRPAARAFWGRLERTAMSPGGFAEHMQVVSEIDIRPVLGLISAPTLVLHRTGDPTIPVGQGRFLAEAVREARFVELHGSDHLPAAGDTDAVVAEIEEFVTGARGESAIDIDRVLTTVMFTDIVRSTERTVALGDDQWRRLLDQHDTDVSRLVEQYRGRMVKSTGDGVLATFDGPARAIRCARAIHQAMEPLGIKVRAGLHTGEVEIRGDDVTGIAVNTAARVQSHARPDEVLVSRTVVDLVAGSGLTFEDRGAHALKGIPGTWLLFAVRS